MKRMSMIIVMGEYSQQQVMEATFEGVFLAKKISQALSLKLAVVFLGNKIHSMVKHFANQYGVDCYLLENELLEHYTLEGYSQALLQIIDQLSPNFIFMAHNAIGSDLAPYLSIRCNADYIHGIESFRLNNGGISFSHSFWYGKLTMERSTRNNTTIATFFPGSFQKDRAENVSKKGDFYPIAVMTHWNQTISTAREKVKNKQSSIKEADVIVSAGNGIGNSENLDLLQGLADCFSRSSIAGSRAACDKGWVDYGKQVGMTGQKVSPQLYFACGISGSLQHIIGMKDSGFVVAINKDEKAPIFQVADIGIVADLKEFLPVLIDTLKQAE